MRACTQTRRSYRQCGIWRRSRDAGWASSRQSVLRRAGSTAVQSQKAVSAHFTSKQILPLGLQGTADIAAGLLAALRSAGSGTAMRRRRLPEPLRSMPRHTYRQLSEALDSLMIWKESPTSKHALSILNTPSRRPLCNSKGDRHLQENEKVIPVTSHQSAVVRNG